MKYLQLALFTIILSFSDNILSQDIITLKDGVKVNSKVVEVTDSEMKYKKYSNLDGPIYKISNDEVHMIEYDKDENLEIQFRSFGTRYYKGGIRINKDQFYSIIKTNPIAYDLFNSGKRNINVGNIIGIPSSFVLGYNLGNWVTKGKRPNEKVLGISGVCWVGSLIIYYAGRSKIKNAVKTYNTSNNVGLRINMNENGVGLAIQF